MQLKFRVSICLKSDVMSLCLYLGLCELEALSNRNGHNGVQCMCVCVAVEKGSNPAGGPVLTIHGFPSSSHDWSKVCLPVYWAARLSVCLSFSLSAYGYKKKIRPPFMYYKSCLFALSKSTDGKEAAPCVYIHSSNVLCNHLKFFFFKCI